MIFGRGGTQKIFPAPLDRIRAMCLNHKTPFGIENFVLFSKHVSPQEQRGCTANPPL
jgi:hypothetical protein